MMIHYWLIDYEFLMIIVKQKPWLRTSARGAILQGAIVKGLRWKFWKARVHSVLHLTSRVWGLRGLQLKAWGLWVSTQLAMLPKLNSCCVSNSVTHRLKLSNVGQRSTTKSIKISSWGNHVGDFQGFGPWFSEIQHSAGPFGIINAWTVSLHSIAVAGTGHGLASKAQPVAFLNHQQAPPSPPRHLSRYLTTGSPNSNLNQDIGSLLKKDGTLWLRMTNLEVSKARIATHESFALKKPYP